MLHLREALKENAEDYGRAVNVPAVYAALRSRFGLFLNEDRSPLSTLRKVERLISIAYGEQPLDHQTGMNLKTFSNTLRCSPLQRHLLENAVRA